MDQYFWLALFSSEAWHGIGMRELKRATETSWQLNLSPYAGISFTGVVMAGHLAPALTLNTVRNPCFILHVFQSLRQFFFCFFKNILLLFNCSCPHFPLITFPRPTHPHLPHSILPLQLSLSMGPSYMFLDDPF